MLHSTNKNLTVALLWAEEVSVNVPVDMKNVCMNKI